MIYNTAPSRNCIITNNDFLFGGKGATGYPTGTNPPTGYYTQQSGNIYIAAGNIDNIIKDNIVNLVVIPDDNYVNSITLPFVDGNEFSSDLPFGWEIDAGGEYAIAIGALPKEVHQVLRWKIYATTNVTEADKMRLEINGYGGTDNEAYTAEVITAPNQASRSSNFAQYDAIYWIMDTTIDVDVDDMFGEDQIMIQVLHESAGGADCETDAVFLCVIIDYV